MDGMEVTELNQENKKETIYGKRYISRDGKKIRLLNAIRNYNNIYSFPKVRSHSFVPFLLQTAN